MSDQIIARVSQSLAKEQSLESLVRQLLEMLEMVTDMESTYLTKVDVEARLQPENAHPGEFYRLVGLLVMQTRY